MNDIKIAISGTVGCGKTTLVNNLGKALKDSNIYKEDKNDRLLELFYTNKNKKGGRRLELLNQFHFLNSTILRDIMSYYDESKYKIYDRPIVDHVEIFAKMNLSRKSYVMYALFQEVFLNVLEHDKYDLTVLLTCDTDTNIERINKRGRTSETLIDIDYFVKLNNMYGDEKFIEALHNYSKEVIIINTTNKSETEVLNEVLEKIEEYESEN